MDRHMQSWFKWTIPMALAWLPVSLVSAQTQEVPLNASGPSPSMSATRIHTGDIEDLSEADALIADELTLHMDAARLADSNKDYKTAADELRRVQAHVQSQMTALQNQNNRLNQLIADTQAGKVTPAELDQAFLQVRHATDRTHAWVPVASEEVDVFMPEMNYHLTRARQEWQAGKNRSSARDVWRAVSYLRMRQDALPTNKANQRVALQRAVNTLDAVATGIQNHKHLTATSIDTSFNEASAAWNGSF